MQTKFDLPDLEHDRLLALVATIEAELTRLGPTVGTELDGMRAAWTELAAALDLEPAVASRACPSCKRLSRTAATLCAYCWRKLPPV